MSFPRYPEYKDSGVEWLGEVPGHWRVFTLKRLVSLKSGESITAESIEENGTYPVYGGNGLRGYTESYTHEGLFALIGRQGALCGNINYANGRFWASEHAVVVSPRSAVIVGWVGELLRAMNLNQYSVSAAQPGLSVEIVGALSIPVPPIDEQSAIAAFLDRETAKIDALVAEQQNLIALLKEKRQALISHAVTKGLDPDVPMKDSGVAWLGQVPAHWVVLALSRVTRERCDGPFGSGIKSDHYTDTGALVVRLQNIRSDGFHGGEPAFLDLEYFEQDLKRHEVVPGDVLIAGLGDENNVVGRACVAPDGISPALVKADCFRFRLDGSVAAAAFVGAQLNVSAVADAGRLANGSTRSRIPLSVMATRLIALPPVAEQVGIVAFVERERAAIDELISEAETTTALLQERRTALISAAVTGKIDVRHLAAAATTDPTPEPA
jgi:type I restriction enzyme S subunit